MSFEETIVARSGAPGAAYRGIVRLSGPDAVRSLNGLFEPFFEPGPNVAAIDGNFFPWEPFRPIPGKVFYWPEGRGYTGRQTVEIHTVGSPPVLGALVDAVCRTKLVRLARPGEFTLQAFLSGRLDLTQAEAVLGVIEAEDEKSLDVALRQLAGNLATPLGRMRETLLDMLAHLEAGFDFADEDIEFISFPEVRRTLENVSEQARALQNRLGDRDISDEKPVVVLTGQPNAGKSTLFNALLEGDRAIVSPVPGTTRDYLEAEIAFGNMSCILVDTAGIDDGEYSNAIDEAARRFSVELRNRAALVLQCAPEDLSEKIPENDKTIVVRTKADLCPDHICPNMLTVSSKTGEGIRELRAEISNRLAELTKGGDVVRNTASRCREAIDSAVLTLVRATNMLGETDSMFDESLLASEIRIALGHLGLIDGTVHADDILDRIFSRFCIGK